VIVLVVALLSIGGTAAARRKNHACGMRDARARTVPWRSARARRAQGYSRTLAQPTATSPAVPTGTIRRTAPCSALVVYDVER
jgi:hypothetical protein